MARARRIEFAGALHHVTTSGNAHGDIFLEQRDRQQFVSLLGDVIRQLGWTCHAWCLLNNHYHLMVETPEPNLGRGMRQLNGVYTQRFNRAHDRVGHVFQGRYKAALVERGPYWLELARQVVLSPVWANLVSTPADWLWSSYRVTAGLAPPAKEDRDPVWPDWILRQLGGEERLARAAYRRFVEDGIKNPVDLSGKLHPGHVLGSNEFLESLEKRFGTAAETAVLLGRGRARPSIATLRAGGQKPRGAWMALAHDRHGYTLAEIGEAESLHYSSISKIISDWRRKNTSGMD